MGRHVISVTLTGRNADLKRALDGSVRDIKKLSDAYRRAGTKLDRDLSANVRNVNRMASAFKRMHGDVDGAGRAFERFMVANDRRIRITHRVNEASSAMRKLGKVMSIVTLGMYGWQLAVSAGGIALSGLSQLLIGAAGGGVVGLFAYLGLTTEKARKEFEKLGNYIRNDLMKRTMPGFYKEVGKLPSVLKKAYNGAKPELVKLGKAMEPLIKQFNNALPKIATSLAKTLTAIVKSSKSAFKAILDSIPVLLNGIKRFFAAFKGSDASVIRKVFQDIADLLAWLGEQLAKLDASDYEAFKEKLISAAKGIANAFKAVNKTFETISGVADKLGIKMEDLIGIFLGMWISGKLLAPVMGLVAKGWQALDTAILGGTIKKLKKGNEEIKIMGQELKNLPSQAAGGTGGLTAVGRDAEKTGAKVGILSGALTKLQGVLKGGVGILSKIGRWFTGGAEGASAFFRVLGKAPVIALVVEGLLSLVDVIKQIFTEGSRIRQIWEDLWNSEGVENLKQGWEEFSQSAYESFQTIREGWDEMWASLEEVGIIDGVKTVVEALDTITQKLYEVRDVFYKFYAIAADAGFKNIGNALKALGQVTKVAANVISNAMKAIGKAISFVKRSFDSAKQSASQAWNSITGIIGGAVARITGFFSRITGGTNRVSGAFGNMRGRISGILSGLMGRISGFVGNMVSRLVSGAQNAIARMVGIFQNLPGRIAAVLANIIARIVAFGSQAVSTVSGFAGAMFSAGAAMMQGLLNGIISVGARVIEAARNIAQTAVNIVKSALNINSPSKVFIAIGQSIGEGFVMGIDASVPGVTQASTNLAESTIASFKKGATKMEKALKKAYQKQLDGIKKGNKKARKEAEKAYTKQSKALKTYTDKMSSALDAYKEKIAEAIKGQKDWNQEVQGGSAYDKMVDAWKDAKSALADYAEELFDLIAPSQTTLIQRAVDGARDSWEDAKDTVDDIKDKIADWRKTLGEISHEDSLKNVYESAKDSLEDLIDAQADFADGFRDTVSSVLDLRSFLERPLQSGGLLNSLKTQAQQAKDYAAQIKQIQQLGGSQALIEEIRKAGIVDGTAIMKQLTNPSAIAEANALVQDIANTANALADDMGSIFYDNQINQAEQAVKDAEKRITDWYNFELLLAQQTAQAKGLIYLQELFSAINYFKNTSDAAQHEVDKYWNSQIFAAIVGTQKLKEIWNNYGKEYKKILKKYGLNYNKIGKGLGGAGTNINSNNDVTYNVSTRGMTGREIVAELKAYERANGVGWRS